MSPNRIRPLLLAALAACAAIVAAQTLRSQGIAGGGPEIRIDREIADHGTVQAGALIRGEIGVKNIGSGILEVTALKTSCNCTSATIDRAKVAAGERATVQYSVRVPMDVDRLDAKIAIATNAVRRADALVSIVAVVKGAVAFVPRLVEFGIVGREELPLEKRVTFRRFDWTSDSNYVAIEQVRLRDPSAGFEVRREGAEANGREEFTVILSGDAPD
jgi:hypothetical protein